MAQVYLIAIPEDEAHGNVLADWLGMRGHQVRTEYGKFGYPPARPNEVTLALWSRAALMSVKRIQMTNRAIDAWETGSLVMVKMDHGIAPQGLSDIEMVDLTFEAAREHTYPQVASAIQAADMAQRDTVSTGMNAPQPGAPMEDKATNPQPATPQSKRRGSSWPLLAFVTLLLAAGVGTFYARLYLPDSVSSPSPLVVSEPNVDVRGPGSDMRPATLKGQVVYAEDPGAAIPGTTITLYDEETGRLIASVRTGESGRYRFDGVPEGIPLTVRAEREAILSHKEDSVTLQDGETRDFNLTIANAPRQRWEDEETHKLERITISGVRSRPWYMDWRIWTGVGATFLLLLVLFGLRSRNPRREVRSTPSLASDHVPFSTGSLSQETDEAHDVFVSYAHADAGRVLPLVQSVEQSGVSIWIDRDDLHGGDGWAGMIVRAIKTSEQFCLMCSEQAFKSNHVRREVYLADKYGKAMIPVKLDSAEMPEDIEYFLIDRQWIDLSDVSQDDLAERLKAAFK